MKNQLHKAKLFILYPNLAEEYLKAACINKKNKLKGITLRYFNTFGPFQIGAFVIPKFINNMTQGKNLVINGTGNQIRSYCFVEDTAKVLFRL